MITDLVAETIVFCVEVRVYIHLFWKVLEVSK